MGLMNMNMRSRPYSRLEKIEERKSKRTAIVFILLTVGFVLFVGFFGISLVSNIAEFISGSKTNNTSQGDTTAPPPPVLFSAPEQTNMDEISISGSTEAGAKVKIYVGQNNIETTADDNGQFSEKVKLEKGDNSIYAVATDSAGNTSNQSKTIIVTLDTEKPEIKINSPKDGDKFYGNQQKQLTIQGSTEADANVTINDRIVILDASGNFKYTTSLQDGDNSFTIKATDKAGNQSDTSITVKFMP